VRFCGGGKLQDIYRQLRQTAFTAVSVRALVGAVIAVAFSMLLEYLEGKFLTDEITPEG